MSWVFFALSGYFLQALTSLGDKIILGKILPRAESYAFWQGILSLGILIFIPFGFSLIPAGEIGLALFSGALWVWGLFFFFQALKLADASRVVPATLSFTPLLLFFMEGLFLNQLFSAKEIFSGALLIAGGVFLSLEFERVEPQSSYSFFSYALVAAFLFAFSFVLMRFLFLRESFLNILIWSRFGLFLGSLLFLLIPRWRKEIANSISRVKKPRGSVPLVLVKFLGALGALSIFFAISRGPATLVQAFQGLQYAFLFLLAALISFFWPWLLKESWSRKVIFQKLAGIVVISFGLFSLIF